MKELQFNCAGMRRRDFLQLGLGGALGLGFSDLLRLSAGASEAGATAGGAVRSGADVNCILVWLDGGPSHYETFDPKPNAPSGIRGEFKSIPTKVTMNEYIELSKFYSTPKSSTFINGVLDKLFAELKDSGEIKKMGRGLLES